MTISAHQLNTLREKTRKAGRLVLALDATATPAQLRDAHTALVAIERIARGLAHPNTTGCSRHPTGPIDPEPPEGWSRCMLCNGYRRRAERADSIPERPHW